MYLKMSWCMTYMTMGMEGQSCYQSSLLIALLTLSLGKVSQSDWEIADDCSVELPQSLSFLARVIVGHHSHRWLWSLVLTNVQQVIYLLSNHPSPRFCAINSNPSPRLELNWFVSADWPDICQSIWERNNSLFWGGNYQNTPCHLLHAMELCKNIKFWNEALNILEI